MYINMTLFGQIVSISLALTVVGTIWFARRKDLHKPAFAILVVFAWLVPVVGPACLLTVLATHSRDIETENTEHVLRR